VGVSSRYGAGGPVTNILPRPVAATASPERAMGAQERKRIEGGLIGDIDGRFVIDLNNQILTVTDASSVTRLELGEVLSGVFGIKLFNQSAELTFSMLNGVNAGVFLLSAGIGDDVGAGATGVALKVGSQFVGNGFRQVAMEGGFTATANNQLNSVGFITDMSFDRAGFTGLEVTQFFLGDIVISGAGTLAKQTALEIQSVIGATTNIAIKTGTGLINFGDVVTATGFVGPLTGSAPAGTLTGTTLASNVVSSSLTSVGTLTSVTVSGAATFNGAVTLGDATGDALTFIGRVASDIDPDGHTTRDLGASLLAWKNIWWSDGGQLNDDQGGSIELGHQDATASVPFIDFHSGAFSTDRDFRIQGSGGTASNSQGTLTLSGATLVVAADFDHTGTKLGFYSATLQTKPTVTGSRGGNAALANLLTDLANLGLITNSSSP